MQHILSNIEDHPAPNNTDDERIILWDNLSVHKTPYVTNIITNRPTNNIFTVVNIPPYRPTIAPIKYMFCELAGKLSRRCNRTWEMATLRQNIVDICGRLGRNNCLQNTFVHYRYQFNYLSNIKLNDFCYNHFHSVIL